MGANCICLQNRVVYSDFNIRCSNNSLILMKKNTNNESPNLSTSFQNYFLKTSVSRTVTSAIKIQSVFRSYFFRKSFTSVASLSSSFPKYNHFFHQHTSNSSQEKVYTNTSIPHSALTSLFHKYPPLSDRIKVVTIQVRFPNMAEYFGEWNADTKERHGRGIQVWVDKTAYHGMWKNDKINGFGKMVLSNGEYYEGEFVDDKAEGNGVYVSNNGGVYVGTWKCNLMDGVGKMTWKKYNEEYEGEFVKGRMNGNGKFTFKDGSVYTGEFVDNKIQGKGIKTWPNNNTYQGEFKDGKFDGQGEFTWVDGRKYIGHYVDDKKNGYGEFTWANGKKYKGTWKDGKQNGNGEIYFPKQDTWKKGTWYSGRLVIIEGY